MQKQLKKLDLLKKLTEDVGDLKRSVEFNNSLFGVLKKDNASLRSDVVRLQRVSEELQQENFTMANELLDLQSRSMKDNIIIHGLPELKGEAKGGKETHLMAEQSVKSFLVDNLKMSKPEADAIRFCRVHCLGQPKPGVQKPRPIMVKVSESKMKYAIIEKGKELKGSNLRSLTNIHRRS
ncbi:hypothetical protein ABVT39_001511 [Epinephelus coioides]